jgi:hypothetical protein
VVRAIAAVLLCAVGLVAGGQEQGAEAALTRPKVIWTVTDPILNLVRCPKGTYVPGSDIFSVDICPGQSITIDTSFTPDQALIRPKLVLQTPTGARILSCNPDCIGGSSLPPLIAAGTTTDVAIKIDVPPGFRNTKASGRLYVADKGSVLVPPLNIRINIVQLTPDERAATPVIVPTNNILMLIDRFNLRVLTVVSGTNVTWTNKHTAQHQVFGTLCQSAFGACNPVTLPNNPACNTLLSGGTAPAQCIDSGPLDPEGIFSVRLFNPDRTQLLRYLMIDKLATYKGCAAPFNCYLTVK